MGILLAERRRRAQECRRTRRPARLAIDVRGEVLSWQTAAAIGTVVQTAVIVATGAFAIVSLRQAGRNQRADALSRVMDYYHSDVAREDRRAVERSPLAEFGHVSPELQGSYDRLVEGFGRIGFLIRNKTLSKDEVLYLYDASILANWERLAPYVRTKRVSLGYTNYGGDFERLAQEARDYITRYYSTADLERILATALIADR